ncbi:MAG: radical SAM protein [Theionarchaea archaeon]|nr:radical SAM protein [Theionarchaea archaeon]MBU7038658.1 radical SAM protein [Theionarchaea archaeon]
MKISRYSFPLKIDEDQYLLVNSRTGAVDLVDREVVELVQHGLPPPDSPIYEFLIERGHLIDLSPEEELNYMEEFCGRLHQRFSQTRTHIIIPTYTCNLRCTYCWEQLLHTRGKEWIARTLSYEEIDLFFAAVDELDDRNSEKKPLIYFGGEPLLPENRELIAYIMKEGSRRGYTHYFVTNGTHIPQYLSLLCNHRIHGVQITLDGTQEVHDARRKGPGNKGSFQDIVEGIEILSSHEIMTHIRVNVDKSNIDCLEPLAAFLKAQGWHTNPYTIPYLASVFNYGCGTYAKAYRREESITHLLSLWGRDRIWEVFKRGVAGFHALESALRDEVWSPQFYNCRAHSNQLFFDPHGNIYPCWEAVGEDEHCVGHFIPSLEFNENSNVWRQRMVMNIKECGECTYAFVCGGGCAYHAYMLHGTVSAPVCQPTRQVLEEYIPFCYRRFLNEGWVPPGMGQNTAQRTY